MRSYSDLITEALCDPEFESHKNSKKHLLGYFHDSYADPLGFMCGYVGKSADAPKIWACHFRFSIFAAQNVRINSIYKKP